MNFTGMRGLGDNLYQRAALHAVIERDGDVTLETPWPQLYADMAVRCVRGNTPLRTQAKNLKRADLRFVPRPQGTFWPLSYTGRPGTMLDGLLRCVQLAPERVRFDGPPVERRRDAGAYVVVRPATLRREWWAAARNPRPEYLDLAARRLARDFEVVSVADLAAGAEWLDGDAPFAHRRYHAGELAVEELLALVANAAAVIGGVGWLVPAALAYRVPMLLVFGGWGAANGPQRIFDPRIDTGCIDQVLPDHFCGCKDARHDCDKRVTDIDTRIERFAVARRERSTAAVAA